MMIRDRFRAVAHATSEAVGSPAGFVAALCVVLFWLFTGASFGYSDSWQLFINTFTTISTFLVVFLIQNTQNRDTRVMQLKLDELIRAVRGARNQLVDLEELSDEELDKLHQQFETLRRNVEKHKQLRLQKKK